MVAPSVSFAMAASAEAIRLSMRVVRIRAAARRPDEECTASRTGRKSATQRALRRSTEDTEKPTWLVNNNPSPPSWFFISGDGSVDILPDEGMPQAIEV